MTQTAIAAPSPTMPKWVMATFAGTVLVMCGVLLFASGSSNVTSGTSLWTDPDAYSWVANWTLEDAAANAYDRVKAMPAAERYYTPGVGFANESFCTSNQQNKFCNHVHGTWGDAVPQTDEWCEWAILEFQDAPAFDFTVGSANYNMFGDKFMSVFYGLMPWLINGSLPVIAAGNQYGDPAATPWPVSSAVWKRGNLDAKWWIGTIHRPGAQCTGLSWGFTFHGHYKAVKCADVKENMAKMGLDVKTFGAEGSFAGSTDPTKLRQVWNAFAITKDHHSEFTNGKRDTCEIGPCNNSTQCDPTNN